MLPDTIEQALRATASIAYTEVSNLAQDLALPEDEYPLAQILEVYDDDICPLCAWLNGRIIKRGTPEWEKYRLPSHINCRRTFAYIPADAGEQPDFEEPPPSLLQKHGHFHVDPLKYEELRAPVFADRRQFVFRRVKDPETGERRSILFWFADPFVIPRLKPGTIQIPAIGAGYIGKARAIIQRALIKPTEEEVQRALQVLSSPPVAGYPPFRESEVRAIGAYRKTLSGESDFAWKLIVEGDWTAWQVAVHEAAEIHAYEAILGIDWTDKAQRDAVMEDAHLYATIQELRFLVEWARQEGYDLPELAIEAENPLRKYTRQHAEWIQKLRDRYNLPDPTPAQKRMAARFWGKIRKTAP